MGKLTDKHIIESLLRISDELSGLQYGYNEPTKKMLVTLRGSPVIDTNWKMFLVKKKETKY